jgi:hypothetical protein
MGASRSVKTVGLRVAGVPSAVGSGVKLGVGVGGSSEGGTVTSGVGVLLATNVGESVAVMAMGSGGGALAHAANTAPNSANKRG